MKPTPQVVQALTNLRASHDFQTVLDFLSAQREKSRDEIETIMEGPQLWRAQGRAIFLREFQHVNDNAPAQLQLFKDKS